MDEANPPTPDALPRRRKVLYGLAAVFIVGALSFVALELAARGATAFNIVAFGDWEALPGVDYKLSGRAEGMNAEGFRDLDRTFAKPDGVFRILFLGDSYVWGTVEREENFPALLEADLNALGPPRRIEIINLGVPSYGPRDSLELWRHYGMQYEPDAVILGFFCDNDVTDNGPGGLHRAAVLGENVLVRPGSLADRSLLLLFLRAKWRLLRYNLAHRGDAEGDSPLNEAEFARIMEGVLPFFDPEAAAQFEGQYRYVESILEEMRAYADLRAIPLYILRLPGGLSIDDAEAERLAKLIGRVPEDYDFDLPNRKIGEIAQRLGIASGTITDAMRAAPDPGAIYMENDTHWNPEGNRLAADAMLPLIREFLKQSAAEVAGSSLDRPDE